MRSENFHQLLAGGLLAAALVCYATGFSTPLAAALVLGGVFEAGFWVATIHGAAAARQADDAKRASRFERYRRALAKLVPRKAAATQPPAR